MSNVAVGINSQGTQLRRQPQSSLLGQFRALSFFIRALSFFIRTPRFLIRTPRFLVSTPRLFPCATSLTVSTQRLFIGAAHFLIGSLLGIAALAIEFQVRHENSSIRAEEFKIVSR